MPLVLRLQDILKVLDCFNSYPNKYLFTVLFLNTISNPFPGHPNAITELKGGEEDVAKLSDSEKKRCSNFDGIWYVCKDEDYVKEMNYLKEKVDAGAGKFCHVSLNTRDRIGLI